jgi:hypothetical protein
MLTRLFPFLDPMHIDPNPARRPRALADDCHGLELGRPVSPLWLRTAPLLEDWAPEATPQGVRLIGCATGHPLLGDRTVVTPAVWFAHPDCTWVRTLSWFYRLGSTINPNSIRPILTSLTTSELTSGDGGSEDEA